MTEASDLGTNTTPPALKGKGDGGAWALWETIAQGRPEFGRPAAFADHVDESKWVSFTATQTDPAFFDLMRDFTRQCAGRRRPGHLRRLALADVDRAAAPAALHRPAQGGERVLGLRPPCRQARRLRRQADGRLFRPRTDDRTPRPTAHRGRGGAHPERHPRHPLHDALHHQPVPAAGQGRSAGGDAKGWTNLGFVGQFVELPDDVVFTVEYSIRAAQAAVSALLDLDKRPLPVYKGEFNPGVLIKAFTALHDLHS